MTKYGAKANSVDGLKFDSLAEARHYGELLVMRRAGLIKDFKVHPRFVLLLPYAHPRTGKKVPGITYIADFLVTYNDGRVEVQDVKSLPTRTPVYKLKKKLFEQKYGMEITEILR